MKQSVNFSSFVEAFQAYDRYEQFGYAALKSLFDYLEQLEDDIGEEIELDVIAICCDYSVDSVTQIALNYMIDIEDMDDDEARNTVLEYLNDNTIVVDSDCEGFILYCSSF